VKNNFIGVGIEVVFELFSTTSIFLMLQKKRVPKARCYFFI